MSLKLGTQDIGAIVKHDTNPIPTGTININQNGTYDVTDYATANVNLPLENCKTYTINILEDITSAGVKTILEENDIIKEHWDEDNLFIMFRRLINGTVGKTSIGAIFNGNRKYSGISGVYIRTSASGSASSPVNSSLKEGCNNVYDFGVDSNGNLKYYMSSSYPIRAGDYVVTVLW